MKSTQLAVCLGLLLGLLLGACGGPKETPTTTPITKPGEATSAPFTINELKFYLGDDLGLQLHADGKLEQNSAEPGKPATWVAMGTLTADGKILLPDNSEGGKIQPDGSFKSSKGEVAPFHFEGDALIVPGGKRLTIDDKGIFQGGDEAGKPLRIEGLTDGGSRRAALFVLVLAFSGGDEGDTKPAPPATP